MNKEDIIRMAREAGLWIAMTGQQKMEDQDRLERFAHLVYESVFRDANIAASRTILDAAVLREQDRCCKIIYSMAGSDNVAQRTVDAIRGNP